MALSADLLTWCATVLEEGMVVLKTEFSTLCPYWLHDLSLPLNG